VVGAGVFLGLPRPLLAGAGAGADAFAFAFAINPLANLPILSALIFFAVAPSFKIARPVYALIIAGQLGIILFLIRVEIIFF
jgi:hypothetical protein